MSFLNTFNQLNWDELKLTIASQTRSDVERALNARRLTHETISGPDFHLPLSLILNR